LKLSKSPRPDCSAGFAARRGCELAFVRAGHVRSARADPEVAKSVRDPVPLGLIGHERRRLKPNHDENARRAERVVKLRAP
jgi:hypothetical protein